jgi:hypothetical protein
MHKVIKNKRIGVLSGFTSRENKLKKVQNQQQKP